MEAADYICRFRDSDRTKKVYLSERLIVRLCPHVFAACLNHSAELLCTQNQDEIKDFCGSSVTSNFD